MDNISYIYANIISLNSDIQERFSWVRVVFCFRDSARACAPSEPVLLSECGEYQLDLRIDMQRINPAISAIRPIYSGVRVVFCFRGSARACAPSEPVLLSECGEYQLDL